MTIKITAAGNVEVPAYLALKEKGFSIRKDSVSLSEEIWFAEKEGEQFSASGPIELLGVVCTYETRGENWKASDEAIDEFINKFKQET